MIADADVCTDEDESCLKAPERLGGGGAGLTIFDGGDDECATVSAYTSSEIGEDRLESAMNDLGRI